MKICQVSVLLDSLKKTFGKTEALDVEQFEINAGDILGLVGNNGAGKTTMFRIILDLLDATEGEVTITADGTAIKPAGNEDWKQFTGAYIDSGFLIDYLTPDEYFDFIGKINGLGKDELAERLKTFEPLMNGEVMGQNKLIRNLSAGNKQKVGIIAAMLHRPQLIILDEPFNFLDPSGQIVVKKMLRQYNEETGATILISSHNLSHTLDICSRVALLEHGRIIHDYKADDEEMAAKITEYFEKGSSRGVEGEFKGS